VHTRTTAILPVFVAVMLLAFTVTARADTAYSAVYVYGDSLSDNGNLFAADGGTYPAPPYFDGRFSNGPVAVEQLAAKLGAPLIDYAFGGATTGIGNQADGGNQTTPGMSGLPGMLAEVFGFPPNPALTPSALFIVWGGANDFEIGGSVTTAILDIDEIVATLESEGAKHILVPGLPDLGLTPEYYNDPAAILYSEEFNAGLQATLPAGATYFDVAGLMNSIVADPAAYGLSDVTDQCYVSGPTACSDPNQYLFWDDIHPTTAADSILAAQFESVVTPEPGSMVLLGSGIAGLAGLLRRRRVA
jgi:cholinesterase